MQNIFGKLDDLFQVFLVLMILDYITGVIVAIYTNKISSSIGHKGIIKKAGVIICIVISRQIDILKLYPEAEVRNVVLLFFVINEFVSITENLKKINIKIPNIISNIIQNKK